MQCGGRSRLILLTGFIVNTISRIPNLLIGLVMITVASVILAPRWLAQKLAPRVQLALVGPQGQRGAIETRIVAIILGVITIVVGLVLEDTILTQAATAGSNTNIGSFSGAQSLNDLVPLIYNAAVVMLGVSMMAVGAAGFAGKGPLR